MPCVGLVLRLQPTSMFLSSNRLYVLGEQSMRIGCIGVGIRGGN
jgi:hypothetical protein